MHGQCHVAARTDITDKTVIGDPDITGYLSYTGGRDDRYLADIAAATFERAIGNRQSIEHVEWKVVGFEIDGAGHVGSRTADKMAVVDTDIQAAGNRDAVSVVIVDAIKGAVTDCNAYIFAWEPRRSFSLGTDIDTVARESFEMHLFYQTVGYSRHVQKIVMFDESVTRCVSSQRHLAQGDVTRLRSDSIDMQYARHARAAGA